MLRLPNFELLDLPKILQETTRLNPQRQETPAQRETKKWKIHKKPRMSASQLGGYVVSGVSEQKEIIENSRKSQAAIVIRYNKARIALEECFTRSGFDLKRMIKCAAAIADAPAISEWQESDNKRTSEIIHVFADLVKGLPLPRSQKIPRPLKGWGHMMIKGVKVSVDPDVVFSVNDGGVNKIGAFLLYTTKDAKKSLAKQINGVCAGDYMAVLLLQMIEARAASIGVPLPKHCYVVDAWRKQIYMPPPRWTPLYRHMEDACESIVQRWGKSI